MGCVNSRTDINDLHPNVFQVMNVDDDGNIVSPGRLEVTDTDIILYQRGKQPIKWPLRCLRRYGYDLEGLFSFESGRRCSTGAGIYAFKCRRAEDLFNLVQTKIQVRNNGGDNPLSTDLPVASHPIAAAIPSEPNYLDPTPRNNIRAVSRFTYNQQNGIGRLNSVGSSNGPVSPQETMGSPPATMPPPPPISQSHPSFQYVNEEFLSSAAMEMERNNNKSLLSTVHRSLQTDNTISNDGLADMELISIQRGAEVTSCDTAMLSPPSYVNVDIRGDVIPISPRHNTCETAQSIKKESNDAGEPEHAYENISPGQEHFEHVAVRVRPPPIPILPPDVEEGSRHCYVNLETNEIERKRFSGTSVIERSPLAPSTPTGCSNKEMYYADLDLKQKEPLPAAEETTEEAVEETAEEAPSPNKLKEFYAKIDFNKTIAVQNCVNPDLENDDEGFRKTRHNSTNDQV